MKILAHTSFIGTTGYANHARSFFCALNKYHTVKVRNLTIGNSWKGMNNKPHDNEPYITKEMKDMLILQTLFNSDNTRSDHPMYNYKGDFKPDVHIVLNDMDNHYFYEEYDGYKIAFNVYESTRYPDHFFQQLLKFDEIWVPTQWQFDSLVEQGCPEDKIRVVTEGVDIETFKPAETIIPKKKFRFLLFGRWDYRKSTTEILQAFGETFKGNKDVEMLCSVENPYPSDETRSTKDRIKKYGINYDNIKFLDFTNRKDYVTYLKQGDVFVSCARSEGWNLPLIEAMSCGTPSIYSNWGGQLQFAGNKGIPVKIDHIRSANIGDREVGGEYCEPDFDDLSTQMLYAYENYHSLKEKSLEEAKLIHEEFNWDKVAKDTCEILFKTKNLIDLKRFKESTPNYRQDIEGSFNTPQIKEKTPPQSNSTDVSSDDFFNSESFYTDVNEITNLGEIKGIQGGTLDVANNYTWKHAVYHEIYNLTDYYKQQEKAIHPGDVIVDIGANMGVFNRWAYSQGAGKVISFEPDKRYFNLLKLNASPKSVLFNAAMSDTVGSIILCESEHFGGSNIFGTPENEIGYPVRSFTLDYLFEIGLVDKIDFLKVDIEGAEHMAFAGISDENLLKVRNIALEYHHSHLNYDEELRENFIQRFVKLGFSPYVLFMGTTGSAQMMYFYRPITTPKPVQPKITQDVSSSRELLINFVDGPYLEIKEKNNYKYNVEFIDSQTDRVEYKLVLNSNNWARCSIKYYVDWIIRITGIDNGFKYEHIFSPVGKKFLIGFDSKSLGDTLAWMPYVDKFQKDNQCEVVCSTFFNHLFIEQYPNIKFLSPGGVVDGLYGCYRLGLYFNDNREVDNTKNPTNPRPEPLLKIGSDILGLEFEEIRPKLIKYNVKKLKRVCIAIHSTAQCKYWNNPTGWQDVVDYLKTKGYEVVLLSLEEDGYMGNKNPRGVRQQKKGSLNSLIRTLQESELFIGISGGLSWVAWSIGIPTILISGFTDTVSEPTIGINRVINTDVCHGCWSDHVFDPGDWNWCPLHKDTDRQFECSKTITSEKVIKEIDSILFENM